MLSVSVVYQFLFTFSLKVPKVSIENSKTDKEEGDWERVRGLMGVNNHLAGVSYGSLGPRTVLELKIDDAIARGDFDAAEKLSDKMSQREVCCTSYRKCIV